MYIESLIAVAIVAIMAASVLPLVSQFTLNSVRARHQSQLLEGAGYLVDQLNNWTKIPTLQQPFAFNQLSVNQNLNQDSRLRLNQFFSFLNPDDSTPQFNDAYKAIVRVRRLQDSMSATLEGVLWYDQNDNLIVDSNEVSLQLSTVVTQLRP